MKIKAIRIENYRAFLDQTIALNRYSCFVGPNGAGKSTILCALNVFFKEQDSSVTARPSCATKTISLTNRQAHPNHGYF